MPIKVIDEGEDINVIKRRYIKQIKLKRFSPEVREAVTRDIDELVCEIVFRIHMELKLGISDPKRFGQRDWTPKPSLLALGEKLDVTRANQNVDCPKCAGPVRTMWVSRHLVICMKPENSHYSASGRSSSRVARQRIQESFKKPIVDAKNDSGDSDDCQIVEVTPRKRPIRGRRTCRR